MARLFITIALDLTKMASKMASISGELIRISPQNKNILAFVSFNNQKVYCTNALVLVPGLTDGMMTMSYTQSLNTQLLPLDYSLVQVNLSTSFNQFGLHTLNTDVEELTEIIKYLVDRLNFKKIILLGHSTGCQDILHLLRHRATTAKYINAIVLQGAVSDRDDITANEHSSSALLKEAQNLSERGLEDKVLSSGLHCDAPITAKRYLSLAGRLTPDDMFSVDLTSEELTPILTPIKAPLLLCFSEQDEYVPNMAAQKDFSKRVVHTLKEIDNTRVVESVYITGDHGLSEEKDYTIFIEKLLNFIRKNC